MKLQAGTILYHGTDCPDFDEASDGLDGPAWVSSSKAVATHFARRSGGWGGTKRLVSYRLADDLELPEIRSRAEMDAFADEHGIDLSSTEAIRDSVAASAINGWILPDNYPDGDDILLARTSALDYVATELCDAPAPASRTRAAP